MAHANFTLVKPLGFSDSNAVNDCPMTKAFLTLYILFCGMETSLISLLTSALLVASL